MKKPPFALVALPLLVLLAGCPRRRSKPDVLPAPAATGVVKADLRGQWRITRVDPKHWVSNGEGSSTPAPTRGLMPPAVGATITIAGREFTDGHGVPLRRQDLGDAPIVVSSYVNQVNDRFAIYTMRRHPDWRHFADGSTATLQMAFGTLDRDHLLGVIYHQVLGPFLQPGDPIEVMVVVHLERVR